MKTVSFGLLNQISTRSESYQHHIRAITDFAVEMHVGDYNRTSGNAPQALVVNTDIDSILDACDQKNTDYAFIVAYGYRSYDHQLIRTMITYMESNQYSVLAHILQDDPKSVGFYSLHNQCLVIDMAHWRQAGRPRFGRHEKKDVVLPTVIRDPNNFHDDYTPGWIMASGRQTQYSGQLREGWSLIAGLLSQGRTIGNFSEEIRRFKQHLYPEVGTELERRLAGELVEVVEHNQKEYVKMMSFSGFQASVYVFNTDPMQGDAKRSTFNKSTRLGTIYCVAAGFKPLQLLDMCQWDQGSRMVYIDYSESALDYRRWLVENWDGKDYLGAVKKYQTEVDTGFRPIWFVGKDYTDQWNYTMQVFGGESAWLDLWNRYRKLEHRYLKVNLYDDYQLLIEDMKYHRSTNNLIWFSNSFYTEACIMNFQPSKLENCYQQFIAAVKNNNDSIQICGTNNTGGSSWFYHGTIK